MQIVINNYFVGIYYPLKRRNLIIVDNSTVVFSGENMGVVDTPELRALSKKIDVNKRGERVCWKTARRID